MAKIEPRILKGFRDYLPEVMVPRVRLLRAISSVFERFGYEPLDTPSIEYADILLGKLGPEAEKLFYRFRDNGDRDVALRYELTISLARVIAQYRELPKPFKRYQMGPVWRAESPARGRFREFWQCDVDIVGTTSLQADAECIAIDHATMTAVGAPNYRIRFNNRKLFRGLQAKAGIADGSAMDAVMRAVDKFDKIGADAVRKELAEGGLGEAPLAVVMDFLALAAAPMGNAARIAAAREFVGGNEQGAKGCDELQQVYDSARNMGVPDDVMQIDTTIVRGLDYYTGTVFETFLTDLPGFGSVMSGGRYDGLIGLFMNEEVPAVGISVGIDRLIAALEELKKLPPGRASAQVLVTIFDEAGTAYAQRIARELRNAGINAELWLEPGAKLQKQLKYAERKGIAKVIVAGPAEAEAGTVNLKTLATREQVTVKLADLAAALGERT
ncbi:MAG: histidine--tRNA ligase [Planctomycetes bacterium]|nr:histidine--tRNA ligase [Planctomycetota bacterium]